MGYCGVLEAPVAPHENEQPFYGALENLSLGKLLLEMLDLDSINTQLDTAQLTATPIVQFQVGDSWPLTD